MTKMKIGIKILNKDEIPDNEPIIVAPGEKFVVIQEINKNDKSHNFDILCLSSLDGIAVYGIYNNIPKCVNSEINHIELWSNNKKIVEY